MARHDEKTSAGREKMLSGGDTGDRLAEVDEVLGCLVVHTVEQYVFSRLINQNEGNILEGNVRIDP